MSEHPRPTSSKAIEALRAGPKSSKELALLIYGRLTDEGPEKARKLISRLRKRDGYTITFDKVSRQFTLE